MYEKIISSPLVGSCKVLYQHTTIKLKRLKCTSLPVTVILFHLSCIWCNSAKCKSHQT